LRDGRLMEGLWIAPSADRHGWPVPDGLSPFELCFEPVFDYLRPLHWYASNYDSGPFDFFEAAQTRREEELDALFVEIPNERNNVQVGAALLRPGFLPDLAPFLYQDWIELVGIGGDEARAREVASELLELHWRARAKLRAPTPAEHYDLLEQHCEVCFFCGEGYSWEIFAKDLEILESVARRIQKLEGIRVERRTLSERGTRFEDLEMTPEREL
jgi:hypothetical protein